MSKILLDEIVKMLGVEYGEFFAVKGKNHCGSLKDGTEFCYVFTQYALHRAMWEKDKFPVIKYGDTRFLPLCQEDFHAICCGMLKVVRQVEGKREFILGEGSTKIEPVEQGSLFD